MGAELDPIIEQAKALPTIKESVEHLVNGIAAKFAESMNDSVRHRALVTEVQDCANRMGDAVTDNTVSAVKSETGKKWYDPRDSEQPEFNKQPETFGKSVTEKSYEPRTGTPTPHDSTYEVPPKVDPASPFSQPSTAKNPVPTNQPISNHPSDPGDHANSFSERDTGKAPETKPNPHSDADEATKPGHIPGKKK